jgi:hypothetical protein
VAKKGSFELRYHEADESNPDYDNFPVALVTNDESFLHGGYSLFVKTYYQLNNLL